MKFYYPTPQQMMALIEMGYEYRTYNFMKMYRLVPLTELAEFNLEWLATASTNINELSIVIDSWDDDEVVNVFESAREKFNSITTRARIPPRNS